MESSLQSQYIRKVVVHPLVMLSIADHQQRSEKGNHRVVGVLLGFIRNGVVDVMNSFAVPFDEDETDNIWFFDHQYFETVYRMVKRVTGLPRTPPLTRSEGGARRVVLDRVVHQADRHPDPLRHPAVHRAPDLHDHRRLAARQLRPPGPRVRLGRVRRGARELSA